MDSLHATLASLVSDETKHALDLMDYYSAQIVAVTIRGDLWLVEGLQANLDLATRRYLKTVHA
jgi:hypothetical protein